jgi:ribonuclease HI
MNFIIYTDGACINNKTNEGYGAWSFFILNEKGEELIHKFGQERNTTNNRMEMRAVIEALKTIQEKYDINNNVIIYCDNNYVNDGASQWIYNWEKRGWKFKGKKRSRKEIKNLDLWKEIFELNKQQTISYRWVKGHSGDYWNERCDVVAESMAEVLRDNSR